MALWGGRFTQEADQKFKFFNDSLRFDYRLALQDIDGSIGWAKAITSVGILTEEEHQQLVAALKALRSEIEPKIEIILKDDAEDIHSWVESKLIEKVGDLGKKLHTGRSRNDQVAVDMKMWCKAQVIVLQERIRNLQEKLVLTAEANQNAVMPGYTHLQRAQPITFAHWCMAYFEMLDRDYSRLTDAYKRMHTCPLGSGALAGTAYSIDRDALAQDLGFKMGTRNSLDSVSDTLLKHNHLRFTPHFHIHPEKKSADKCNFCRDTNLAEGKQPACVEACPTKALTFGDMNDPHSAVAKKVRENPVYRTKVHLGTEPNLYHIPFGKGEHR